VVKKINSEKFVDRYGVETYQTYKRDPGPDVLKIAGPGHFLYDETAPTTYDERRVQEIDHDGKMTTPIEFWVDKDDLCLYVVDGRWRLLDVREVNRRREKDGRELVKPLLVPFTGDEKACVARVRTKNYHRRLPTPSGMAVDLLALRNAGWSWDDCAAKLHVDTVDAEQWGRKLFPMAYCIDEVRQAIDSGEFPRGVARKFGGSALDGSGALSKKEQLALLQRMREDVATASAKVGDKVVSPKKRERLREVLSNGATAKLAPVAKTVAEVVVATLAFVDGDARALRGWPEVAALVDAALVKPAKAKAERRAKIKAAVEG
jgi:hypothetical protein